MSLQQIESQIRELYGRTVWTHKTHEKCADRLLCRNKWLNIIQIFLSAITTTGFLIIIFGDGHIWTIVGIIASTLLFWLNLYIKDANLWQKAQRHADIATDLWNVRESYLSLLSDIKSNAISIDQAKDRRDALQEELFEIYKQAPRTDNKSFKKASKWLKDSQEFTFSDEEIDKFLPEVLRKK